LCLITPSDTHHSESSGRGIGPSQRPPDNTRLQEMDILAPAGCEPAVQASELAQTYALFYLAYYHEG